MKELVRSELGIEKRKKLRKIFLKGGHEVMKVWEEFEKDLRKEKFGDIRKDRQPIKVDDRVIDAFAELIQAFEFRLLTDPDLDNEWKGGQNGR